MAQGTGEVRWFNNVKSYGFLGREGRPDVFVHYSAIVSDGYRSLKEGEKVSFDIVQGEKGPKAERVTRLSQPLHHLEIAPATVLAPAPPTGLGVS